MTSKSTSRAPRYSVRTNRLPITMNPETKALGAVLLVTTLMLLSVTAVVVRDSDDSAAGGTLAGFEDRADLERFLTKDAALPENAAQLRTPDEASYSIDESGTGVPYSQTNVQVEGVDEDDFVKTDGEYIYVASYQEVSILRAYPAEDMQEVSSIPISAFAEDVENETTYVSGLFVSGDKLVVIANHYAARYWWFYASVEDNSDSTVDQSWTVIWVFDISDPTVPRREFSVGISGYAISCRMIGDTVYAITQHQILIGGTDITVPHTYSDGEPSEVGLSTIRYDPGTPEATSYVNILAVDLDRGMHSSLSILAGWASTIYVSSSSLYLTIQKWTGPVIIIEDVLAPEEADETSTSIYRIDLDGVRMYAAASGDVSGWLLNQFSMDEHESYLRVATTTGWMNPENAVFVLDDDLNTVGALEGLAPDESIYSARFVSDTLYLVTFQQVDPLFVIDLSTPDKPAVVGMLEIPGFSTYLHPIDDTHILGIGQENWTVKLSLFDVSDPANPVEQSKYLLDDYGWSSALYDHHAVLYYAEKGLLVIPGYAYCYEALYTYRAVSSAYVFTVSASEGISLRGVVTHDVVMDWSSGYIERALYIGEYLYTVSRSAVQANLLEDLTLVKLVQLGGSADDSTY